MYQNLVRWLLYFQTKIKKGRLKGNETYNWCVLANSEVLFIDICHPLSLNLQDVVSHELVTCFNFLFSIYI